MMFCLKSGLSKLNSILVFSVGSKISHRGVNLVIVVTSNIVSVIILQGSYNIFVDPSQKKIEQINMHWLYVGSILEIWIMSKISKFSHSSFHWPCTLSSHAI